MKYKKAAVILVAMILILNTFGFTYGETPFTDIENHWAKDNIISVYNKGLMGGTSEDKFSPDVTITKYSVIKAIGSMMGTGLMDLTDLLEKYKDTLELYNVPDYARKEIAYCIEKNIVQPEIELPKFESTPYATKLDICVYLGRAFGVELDTSKPPVTLLYKDALDIPSMYKIYVDHMIKIGVVDGNGDKDGMFNPNTPASRAMFAKMLDIASTEYNKTTINTEAPDSNFDNVDDETDINEEESKEQNNDISSSTDDKDTVSERKTDRGIIDTITYKRNSQPKILLENESNEFVEYTVPEDLMKENIIVNGQLSDVYSLRPGLYVELKVSSGVVEMITTLDMTRPFNATATVKEVDILNKVMYVEVDDGTGQISEKRVLLDNTKVADSLLNILTIDALAEGQSIIIIGTEDLEAVTAQSIIINY